MAMAVSGWMLYTMWVVLGLIGLHLLVDVWRAFVTRTLSVDVLVGWLGDMITYVLPLIIVAAMLGLDPTGWVVLIFWYIGAIGVILKKLKEISSKLK